MKLLARQNRYYIGITLALLIPGIGGLYGAVHLVFRHGAEESLVAEAARLRAHVGTGLLLPPDGRPETPILLPYPVPGGLRDTVLPDPDEAGEPTEYRQLVTPVMTPAGRRWLVMRRSLLETDALVTLALAVLLPILGAILGALLLLNRRLARRLWAPLEVTLQALAAYDGRRPLTLAPTTSIDEFDDLNRHLEAMSARVAQEVETLRAFTENAAHETQTPLAILRARLDQLVQLPTLPREAHALLADVSGGLSRLVRLHQALTLLSKIENGQFPATAQALDLGALASARLEELSDLIEAKHLTVVTDLTHCPVRLHPALAESLVRNLLQNAVRHNLPHGRLLVRAQLGALLIENTGPVPHGPVAHFFERFRKHDPTSESPGLGLAICEQIARAHGLTLTYTFDGETRQHRLAFGIPPDRRQSG